MPNTTTHIGFIKKIEKTHHELFHNLDLYTIYSGSVFPDIYYFIPFKFKYSFANLSAFWHKDLEFGIEFGKKLLKYSRNKFEKSFALGFISHAIVDKHVHKYLKSKKIYDKVDHIIAEFFLDASYPIEFVPLPIYPKTLLKLVIKKEYPNLPKRYYSQASIDAFKLMKFTIKQYIIRQSVHAKYTGKKKIKMFHIIEIIKWGIFKIMETFMFAKKLKKVGYNIADILHPKYKIKDQHLKNMINVMSDAEKEYLKILKNFHKND